MSGIVWRTPAVSIERVDVPAGTSLINHGHDVPHLCFLEEGVFEERHRKGRTEVEAGTLRSSPAGDEHDIVFPKPSRCLLVLVHGDPAAVAPRLPVERRFLKTRRLNAIASRLSRGLHHDGPEISDAGEFSLEAEPPVPDRRLSRGWSPSSLAVEAIVLELLAAALAEVQAHRQSPPPPWLRRIRERLHAAPASPPTTFELAFETGYHPVYVARAFRRYYGVGIGEYARVVRAEYARRLLATTEAPLAEVAMLAGYADQSHLNRSMRRLLDVTPAQVRRGTGSSIQVGSLQELGARSS